MTDQQYMLVNDGSPILDRDGFPLVSPFLPKAPEGFSEQHPSSSIWLPITNEDTQPFELRTHWRDAPSYEVRANHVARIYAVRRIGQSA